MSRLSNLRLVQGEAHRDDAERAALVEDYLDHVCAPLVGIVPYAERQALRVEVESHLDALADEYRYQGKSPLDATHAALAEFGQPWRVGESFLREWVQGAPDADPRRLTRQATKRAFACFGPFTVATLLMTEQYALAPGGDAYLPWAAALALLTPFAAGLLNGWGLPPRVGRGTFRAVALLALDAAATGLVMLPHTEGLKLALFLTLYWLPFGCLTSSVTSALVRQHRRQHFRRLAR